MADQIYCGIDFGTSNSTCALYHNGQARLVPLEQGKGVMPSAIFYEEGGDVLLGHEGIAAYVDGEDGRLMRGLKSVLGTPLMNERTVINGRATYFKDVLRAYIYNLKKQAEAFAGERIDKVVMGRPVHFHDNNPDADSQSEAVLRDVASAIGFKDIVFQYEPIAAAFSHEQAVRGEQLSLVVDLGGGTSDFTVIKLSGKCDSATNRENDILATGGVRIGGTNFDKQLSLNAFMSYLGMGSQYRTIFDADKILDVPTTVYSDLSDWPRVNFAQTSKALRDSQEIRRTALEPKKLDRLIHLQKEKLGHAYLQHAEKTKIELSACDDVVMPCEDIGFDFSVETSRQDFQSYIRSLLGGIEACMLACLSSAKVSAEDIKLVVLTGGSSELPVINKMVLKHFPHAAVSKGDKFSSVGLGLAYAAPMFFDKNS